MSFSLLHPYIYIYFTDTHAHKKYNNYFLQTITDYENPQ